MATPLALEEVDSLTATNSESKNTKTVPPTVLSEPKVPTAALVEAARLWHVRLEHISLNLLKKTAKITTSILDFQKVRPTDLVYQSCNAAKIHRRLLESL